MRTWFGNLSTQAKLSAGFGSLLVLLLLVAFTTHRALAGLEKSQDRVYSIGFSHAFRLSNLETDIARQRLAVLHLLTSNDPAVREKGYKEIDSLQKRIEASLAHLEADADPEERKRLSTVQESLRTFATTRDSLVLPLARAGRFEEALRIQNEIQLPRFERIHILMVGMADEGEALALKEVRASGEAARLARMVLWSATALAVLLGMVVVNLLSRSIAVPLADITRLASQVAEGDLSSDPAPLARQDEVGRLSQTFSRMVVSLRAAAGAAADIARGDLRAQVTINSEKDALGRAFAGMVENLRKMTTEITEGMNLLSTSSSQILATTQELAAGSAQTATAISQATTTVEEVKQTAHLSNQKAKAVADSAQHATVVAREGRQALEDSLEAMTRIKEHVNSIAESTVRLGEQSQSIGNIIATVVEIADQANLLSVNASIEAARAGEAGKGFTVVAQEVKAMAERSREAAKQVRNILNDIQKRITSAVMATELGSKTVDAGMRQMTDTGQSISALARTITDAAQSAMQINASSQQQLVGMDQVGLAMESIKQASSQTVAGSSQTNQAVKGLHELGQRLNELVSRYKL
ncbi:MAG TPA: methyl-accepting chemotaxis protein [Fibrobacteria bacterium]|nr:methyl-accepting chemotaxis protein [Fibrobacteria bacterium]